MMLSSRTFYNKVEPQCGGDDSGGGGGGGAPRYFYNQPAYEYVSACDHLDIISTVALKLKEKYDFFASKRLFLCILKVQSLWWKEVPPPPTAPEAPHQ